MVGGGVPTSVSTHTGRWYPPSSRHPDPLADWWPLHSTSRFPTSTNPWSLVVCLCWCSWTSVLLCVVLIFNGGIVVMGVCLRRFCLDMRVVGDICLFWVGPGYDELLWVVLFRSDVRWVLWCLWLCCVVGCWGMCWLWWCECVSCLSWFLRRLWCWSLCQCMWCSVCCMLFVSYVWVM